MQISIRVVLSDGQEVKTRTGYADTIALEEKFGIATTDFAPKPVIGPDGKQATDANGEPLEEMTIHAAWLAFLAWNSLRRRKETDLSFDAWRDQIEELELANEEDDSGN